MTAEKKRTPYRILKWILILTSPVLFISLFLTMALLLSLPFHVGFTVKNNTDKALMFTPVGTWGDNNRAVLRQYMTSSFGIPSCKLKHIRLEPGQNKTVLYDYDDINFSHIYIKTLDGREKQLVTNPNAVEYSDRHKCYLYRPPTKHLFSIQDIASLPIADPDVTDAVHAASEVRCRIFLFVLLLSVCFPFAWLALSIAWFVLRPKGATAYDA
jgi:hypothetical protein